MWFGFRVSRVLRLVPLLRSFFLSSSFLVFADDLDLVFF